MLTYEEFLSANPSLETIPENEKILAYENYKSIEEAEEAKVVSYQLKIEQEAKEAERVALEAAMIESGRIAEELRRKEILDRVQSCCGWDYSIISQVRTLVTSSLKAEVDNLIFSDTEEGELFIKEIEAKSSAIKAMQEQVKINKEAQDFLSSTDWKSIRHISQQMGGVPQSLTAEEYASLESKRQIARDSIAKV
jgi:hypothetical protein